MKKAGKWILVVASFLCGVFLSPLRELTALFFSLGFAGITAFLIFATSSSRRILGIALGLSSVCAMVFSDFMFRTAPDAFPPYPLGMMDSMFPAERYPSSEKSFDAIDTRLHWYGLIASLPFTIGLALIFQKFSRRLKKTGHNKTAMDKPDHAPS